MYMHIGIIGLGLVGNAIAERLIAAGHVVYGYDIVPAACKKAEEQGVRIQNNAAEVTATATTLFLCLMTSEDRRTLLWGAQAMAESLQPDSILLDISTSRPEDILADADRLSVQTVRLVDVCLSGSSEVIARGEALALVGDREAGAAYIKILSHFTKAHYFLGGPGEGNRMKLIVNLVFGLNRLVLAEALGLAAKAGYNLNTVLEILKAGETYSVCMDTKGPKMATGVYEPPVARLAQHAKDVDLILELARGLHARTPVSEVHAHLLRELLEAGAGGLDNAAIFKAYT
jgi:3-hydroxyisobutyrate dehydrogenase-like beta-hydroxyacid dehydrogenase